MPMSLSGTVRRGALALGLVAAACASHAATRITFDERPWIFGSDEYAFWSNPITTEYDGLGVDLGQAYLQPADPASDFSGSQYILGGNGYSIGFTGTLPTFVSLAFGSPLYTYRATVTALDASGFSIGSANTGGDYLDDHANWVTAPFQPRSFAAFHSDAGISRLVFNTETGPRLEAKLDNLYFGQTAAVPEPTTIVLWLCGLLAVGLVLHGSAAAGVRAAAQAPYRPRSTRPPR